MQSTNAPLCPTTAANRGTADVPMVVPEINAEHIELSSRLSKKRLGTKERISWPLSPTALSRATFPPSIPLDASSSTTKVLACTYQAISGAGKDIRSVGLKMVDNLIPYIGGEEEKSRAGASEGLGSTLRAIRSSMQPAPAFTTQCIQRARYQTVTLPPFLSPSKRNPPSRKS